MLLRMRALLKAQPATLPELAKQLEVDIFTAWSILGYFLRKAEVALLPPENSSCGSRCGKCLPVTFERYSWVKNS